MVRAPREVREREHRKRILSKEILGRSSVDVAKRLNVTNLRLTDQQIREISLIRNFIQGCRRTISEQENEVVRFASAVSEKPIALHNCSPHRRIKSNIFYLRGIQQGIDLIEEILSTKHVAQRTTSVEQRLASRLSTTPQKIMGLFLVEKEEGIIDDPWYIKPIARPKYPSQISQLIDVATSLKRIGRWLQAETKIMEAAKPVFEAAVEMYKDPDWERIQAAVLRDTSSEASQKADMIRISRFFKAGGIPDVVALFCHAQKVAEANGTDIRVRTTVGMWHASGILHRLGYTSNLITPVTPTKLPIHTDSLIVLRDAGHVRDILREKQKNQKLTTGEAMLLAIYHYTRVLVKEINPTVHARVELGEHPTPIERAEHEVYLAYNQLQQEPDWDRLVHTAVTASTRSELRILQQIRSAALLNAPTTKLRYTVGQMAATFYAIQRMEAPEASPLKPTILTEETARFLATLGTVETIDSLTPESPVIQSIGRIQKELRQKSGTDVGLTPADTMLYTIANFAATAIAERNPHITQIAGLQSVEPQRITSC